MTAAAFHYSSEAVDPSRHDLPGLKASFVLERIPDGTTVLDLGCGGGKVLRTIADHRSDVTLMGCDVVAPPDAGEVFTFTAVDPAADRLPYPDAAVDVVLLLDVLEHVRRPSTMLAEAARITRPDGRLLAFIPIEGEPVSWYRAFRRLFGQDLYARTKGHIQAFTHAEVERLVGEHFIVEERVYAYHPIGQLMDAGLCAAMDVGAVQRAFWAHSPYHGEASPPRSVAGRAFATLLRLANALAWAESRLLRTVRRGAAGVLLSARPRDRGSAPLGH